MVRGATSYNATWQEPVMPNGVEVKGYVLVVAEPNKQKTRYFRRIITNPDFAADPDYNASACTGGACTTPLNFPLQSTDGSSTLLGDGSYHMALITLYTDSIRRSDGRCDDGTGVGSSCAPTVPKIKVIDPGVSTWQILMRPDAWPDVFVEPMDDHTPSTSMVL